MSKKIDRSLPDCEKNKIISLLYTMVGELSRSKVNSLHAEVTHFKSQHELSIPGYDFVAVCFKISEGSIGSHVVRVCSCHKGDRNSTET